MEADNQQQDSTAVAIGQELRAAREGKGLSIGEVADRLKLSVKQLNAIERGDFASLPGATFARGFVRSYARYMEMNILHAGSMQPVHPVFHKTNVFDYLPRNSTATGFFTFSWDGTRIHSNGGKGKTKVVPNGDYVLQLKVLKALGDENNPAHWETWTSPVINIAR